jgi:hypothetical protein
MNKRREFLKVASLLTVSAFFTACGSGGGIISSGPDGEVREAYKKLIETAKKASSGDEIKPLIVAGGTKQLLEMGASLEKKFAEIEVKNVRIAHDDHNYDFYRQKGGTDFDVGYVQVMVTKDKNVHSGQFAFIKKDGKWLLASIF